jgi:hypothetical protein
MHTPRRLFKLAPVLILIALALPSAASAQATRTWVSGVGDDANPCSRTAPCKTFAGAISKTAAGGEINCLDPGGFGGVTIGKSLIIKCHYTEGGVLVAGTNAIVINAGPSDRVVLKGLDIFGAGTGAQTSLTGIKILSAGHVVITDNEIYRFQVGIAQVPTSAATTAVIKNNHIHENGIGYINAPGNNLIQFTSAVLRNNDIQDNTCGVVASAGGANASTPVASNACGTVPVGAINKIASVFAYHNGINLNSSGVVARGSNGLVELGFNEVTNNLVIGLDTVDGGFLRTTSPPTNVVSGNAASDAPNATVTMTKRQAKRARKLSHKRRI